MLDRLKLDPARLTGIAAAVEQVAALEDPVGMEIDSRTQANEVLREMTHEVFPAEECVVKADDTGANLIVEVHKPVAPSIKENLILPLKNFFSNRYAGRFLPWLCFWL